MSVIIRLQNLSWDASAADIRRFFTGMSIPDGGVHIIGGEKGDAFIAFSTDDDARRAMMLSGKMMCNEKIVLMLSSKNEMNQVIAIARGEDPAVVAQTTSPTIPSSLPSSVGLVAPTGFNPLISATGQIPMSALNQITNMTHMNLNHLNPLLMQQNQMKQPLIAGYPAHQGFPAGEQGMFGIDTKNSAHVNAITEKPHLHGKGFQNPDSGHQARDFRNKPNPQAARDAETPSYPPATDSVPRDRWHEGPPRIQGPPKDFPRRPALLGAGPRPVRSQAPDMSAPVDPRLSAGELRRPLMASPLIEPNSSIDHHFHHTGMSHRPLMNNRPMEGRSLLEKPSVDSSRPLIGRTPRDMHSSSRWSNIDQKPELTASSNINVEQARSSRDDERRREDRRDRDRSERSERSRERDREKRSSDDHGRDRPRSNQRETKEKRDSRERDRRERDRSSDEGLKKDRTRDRDRRDRDKSGSRMEGRSERDRRSSSEKERDSDRERRRDRHERSEKSRDVLNDDMSHRNHDTNGDSKRQSNSQPAGLLPHPSIMSRGMTRMIPPFLDDERGLKRPRESGCCVFVSNMPLTVSYRNIRRFFSGCEILHDGLKLINDSSGNRCGTAYVKFATPQSMQYAMEKAGRYMDDRQVSIVKCSEMEFEEAIDSFIPSKKQRSLSPMRQLIGIPDDLCVCIKGLPSTVDINEIHALFHGLKFIANSIYIEYGLDGKALGTAYLEFATSEDFRQAIEIPRSTIDDRVITVRPMSRKEIESHVKYHKDYLEKQKTEKPGENVTDENGSRPTDLGEPASEDQSDGFCCHLFGLSYQSTEADIQQFFNGLNVVPGSIKIVRFPDGRAAGDCLIEFASQDDQEEALKRNQQYMGKRFLYVNKLPSRADAVRLFHTKSSVAEQKQGITPLPLPVDGHMAPMGHPIRGPPRDPRRPLPGPLYPDEMYGSIPPRPGRPACVIGITNIHFRSTPAEVIEFFRGFRPITESLRLRRNPETGKPTGEGTIAFHSPPDAIRAVCELNGNTLAGRPVSLYQI
ncbi:uncharacterized protein LOC141901763 [Tubulanus polymorphus]|uniref:uncharacterized protein LOC141901763 n=1 Tax=Tubulanus polymorphus TaxID=672921 RepID=UPI003DA43863